MKVLWVTNTIFPDLSLELGSQVPVIGGWMYSLAKDLIANGIELVVATTRPKVTPYQGKINGITYFLLSGKTASFYYDRSLETQWQNLINKTSPDLVHVHGTEYAHGLSLIKACPNLKYVVSIQGMISLIARYYESGIPIDQIKKNKTFRDFVKSDSILQTKAEFQKRGNQTEKDYFKLVKHIIGRTEWDHDHSVTLNPQANYFFCNESLRDSFYTSRKWESNNKKDHTIFLSQAGYPIKGFHQVIKAIALLKLEFPNVNIRIAGNNILRSDTLKDRLKLDGYAKYVINLVQEHQLINNITFTGPLNEEGMIQQYLNCHVFICPSSIENSPNSLGEAQILGVPCIASYVGGVPDMIKHKETGLLYRFEEIEMLAQAIKSIFTDYKLTKQLSESGILAAKERHNRSTNLARILEIYETIASN